MKSISRTPSEANLLSHGILPVVTVVGGGELIAAPSTPLRNNNDISLQHSAVAILQDSAEDDVGSGDSDNITFTPTTPVVTTTLKELRYDEQGSAVKPIPFAPFSSGKEVKYEEVSECYIYSYCRCREY